MAFESLSDKLQNVFKNLRSKGRLTEADVKASLKEVKMALLEADVNFKVVKQFINSVTERAVGQDVMNSLTPGQMVIKIVNEEMVALMGSETTEIKLNNSNELTVIMMAGLQGAGYVTEIQIGNRLMSGEDFRYALELPSACFKIAFESNQVQIRVYGRGHGVGFDQYGANRQAKEGKNYEQLLQYYLTGVKVGE